MAFDTFFYQKSREMIRFHLKELIADKEFAEKRRITIGEIANETGINRMTLSKIINHPGHSTVTDNIDKLCTYFDCSVEQLITHIKEASDESEGPDSEK
ncbi:helix-turn-helix domain-containing protein [Marinobacter sp.]|uniref:helix-turn-helix domain-containing protein n=1 Tax=Marinobacter sp. TaxID=50741 RepID=UPI003A93E300